MLSHSLGSTHTLHAEEVHQEPDEVVSASPQHGENTRVPRDLEVHSIPRMRREVPYTLQVVSQRYPCTGMLTGALTGRYVARASGGVCSTAPSVGTRYTRQHTQLYTPGVPVDAQHAYHVGVLGS
jgi:hypothetical protein